MTTESADLWHLLAVSQLVPPERIAVLRDEYRQAGLPEDYSAVLARWLTVRGAISPYQAKVLLAGRSGPFRFGEFLLADRREQGRLKGLFQATHVESQRPAWLWLFPRSATNPEAIQGAVHLAKRLAAAKHPALLRCYGTFRAGGSRFAVLEFFSDATLEAHGAGGRLAPPQACRVARQLAQGLACLHTLGVAHGDVRPGNVLVDESGRIKLLHFPLSRDPFAPAALEWDRPDSPRLQQAADYAAPELAAGQVEPSVSTDLYALGCVLYELLTGHVPYGDGTPLEKVARHAREPFPEVSAIPGVDRQLAALVGWLTSKDAALRPPSAAEVVQQLKPFAGSEAPLTPLSTVLVATVSSATESLPTNGNGAPSESETAGGTAPSGEIFEAPYTITAVSRRYSAAPDSDQEPPDSVVEHHEIHAGMNGSTGESEFASGTKAGVAVDPALQNIVRPPIESILGTTGGAASALARVRQRRRQRRMTQGSLVMLVLLAAAGLSTWAWRQGWLSGKLTAMAPSGGDFSPALANSANGESSAAAKLSTEVAHAGANDTLPATTDADPDGGAIDAPSTERAIPAQTAALVVEDDGQTLWASPTDGAPIDLDFLTPGAQGIFVMRPADFFSHAEAENILAALGPAFPSARQRLEELLGLPLADVELLKVALYCSGGSISHVAAVAELRQPGNWSQVSQHWKGAVPAESQNGAAAWRGADYSYFVPTHYDERVLVVGDSPDIAEMLAQPRPAMRKELERLLRETDEQRHFTMLFAPRDLVEGEGRPLLSGHLARLRQSVEDFLAGADVKFAAFSLHLDENLFVELRLASTIEANPEKLAGTLRERLGDLPNRVENYLAGSTLHPHGKLVLMRLPRMLSWLHEYTRSGTENRQSVLRAYLPAVAAHNLILGAELALAEQPSASVSSGPGPAKQGAKSVAEALKTTASISFTKDTLEKSLELLAKEMDVEIVIMGGDLQLDGITKNQSFELNERDKPAGEILQTILKKANPDGKLVYVIKPQDGKETLFITTRSQAERRGDPLPESLR